MVLMALLLSDDDRIKRLRMASERVGGDAELGRMLGYKDGAFVGQMLRGDKPITEKTINKLLSIRKVSDLFVFDANTGFKTAHNESMPLPMSPETDKRLTRFLAVLYQLPEDKRALALIEATEALLDRLPAPPIVAPGAPDH
jgi:hypothetical protein